MLPVFLCLLWLLTVAKCSQYDESGKKEENSYYEIYEAKETLSALTPHSTFYELLGVSPSASSDEVSRSFRRLSIQYHPDKLKQQGLYDERAESMSKLIQFVGSLLRTEKGRREYDWILNEAPAWHRQSVFAIRRKVPSGKISTFQVGIIVALLCIGLPLLAQWIAYATSCYMIVSSRWAIAKLGEKEVKRIRKRMVNADPQFIALNNSTYHTILLADSTPPSIPSPLDIWLFRIPLQAVKFCLRTLRLLK